MKKFLTAALLAASTLYSGSASAKKPQQQLEIKKPTPMPAGTLDPYIIKAWKEEFQTRSLTKYYFEERDKAQKAYKDHETFFNFNDNDFFEFRTLTDQITSIFQITYSRSKSRFEDRINALTRTIDFVNNFACLNTKLNDILDETKEADMKIAMDGTDPKVLRDIYALTDQYPECDSPSRNSIVLYWVKDSTYFSGPDTSAAKKQDSDSPAAELDIEGIEMTPAFVTGFRFSYSTAPVIRLELLRHNDKVDAVELELYFNVPQTTQESIKVLTGRADFQEIDNQFYHELQTYPKTEIIDVHRDGLRVSHTLEPFEKYQIAFDSVCISPSKQTPICHEFAISSEQRQTITQMYRVGGEMETAMERVAIDYFIRGKTLNTYAFALNRIFENISDAEWALSQPGIIEDQIEVNRSLTQEVAKKHAEYEQLLEDRVDAKNPFGEYLPK